MNRRGFLGALGAAIAGATLDPERALWVPGKRLISIPKGRQWPNLVVGDIITFEGVYKVNPRTLAETRMLQQFICTRSKTVEMYPPRIFSGPYQNVAAVGRVSSVPDVLRAGKCNSV